LVVAQQLFTKIVKGGYVIGKNETAHRIHGEPFFLDNFFRNTIQKKTITKYEHGKIDI